VDVRVAVFLACALVAVSSQAAGSAESPAKLRGVIAYWTNSPYPSIWAIRADGSRKRRILHSGKNAKWPRISPDRRWVAFDGASPGKPSFSDFDIQVVGLNGKGRRTVTDTADWDIDAQWSPDGTLLSFSRRPPYPVDDSPSTIWIVRSDGTQARPLVPGFDARWSPDGTKLVYDDEGDLFVVGADGSGSRRLLATPAVEQPAGWSPDGRKILFTRYSGPERRETIYVMNADGTGARRLARGIAACWSPDGAKILYTIAFASGLYVMDANGSHKRRIPGVAGSEPSWR
jgi:TolB protein